MKHLRLFESKDLKFKEGDIIVLIYDDEENESLTAHFNVGNLYKIQYIDEDDVDGLPYRLCYINDTSYSAWIEEYRIRLAEPWEIDQMKYNL